MARCPGPEPLFFVIRIVHPLPEKASKASKKIRLRRLRRKFLFEIRHPERSEAKDFSPFNEWTRAQSKDLLVFPGNSRNGFGLLQAKLARRSVAMRVQRYAASMA